MTTPFTSRSSWLMLPLALFLAVLGALSSPRDAQGRPLLLLPDVKAVEEYRRSMSSATADMQLSGWRDCCPPGRAKLGSLYPIPAGAGCLRTRTAHYPRSRCADRPAGT